MSKAKKCSCGYEKFFHSFSRRLHTALAPAVKRWQKENGEPLTYPDTVKLVEWLVREASRATEGVTLYEGLCKVGEPDFEVLKGRGDNESVVLIPVPYKMVKGRRGSIVFFKSKVNGG